MTNIRRAMAVALPAAAALAFSVSPAQAGVGITCTGEANCGTFYYNSGLSGSRTTFTGSGGINGSISDLAGYKFLDSGAGKGTPVKNGAASFYNGSPTPTTIFFNSGYNGACDTVAPYTNANRLANTYNNNAALAFGASGSNCYKFN
ncbi:hypothetical protein AB0O22_12150 [Streptomyces sp. NPDC091204]|uniref:hypothetical protein n=1 Tax=Streptomyces sp. NPDC091204 TaxID=3155299 RepID=UPI0034355FC0